VSRLRGRFSAPTDPEMDRFSSSIEVDMAMAQDDIAGSRAHAIMLGEVGVISPDDAERLVQGLEQIARELESEEFVPTSEHEDIHMAVEARLFELLGETAGKLHTARSRNDQVATDVRLWLRRQLEHLDDVLGELIHGLVDQAREAGQILMPGYTHLQRGQPILLGHHLLGHIWPVVRDRQRLAEARQRLDASPLGAGALAGTGLPIDRQRTAELLGFSGVVENALDAVAARDHEQEVAAVCAIAMTHLSRMAAELVLWSSAEFRFVELDQAYATGSSIMPQKRNPDAAELVRGKAARVYGDLVTLLTLSKGLPLAYNRDLQEDRRPLDSSRNWLATTAWLQNWQTPWSSGVYPFASPTSVSVRWFRISSRRVGEWVIWRRPISRATRSISRPRASMTCSILGSRLAGGPRKVAPAGRRSSGSSSWWRPPCNEEVRAWCGIIEPRVWHFLQCPPSRRGLYISARARNRDQSVSAIQWFGVLVVSEVGRPHGAVRIAPRKEYPDS
jgi:argininosuccinate lyase